MISKIIFDKYMGNLMRVLSVSEIKIKDKKILVKNIDRIISKGNQKLKNTNDSNIERLNVEIE